MKPSEIIKQKVKDISRDAHLFPRTSEEEKWIAAILEYLDGLEESCKPEHTRK